MLYPTTTRMAAARTASVLRRNVFSTLLILQAALKAALNQKWVLDLSHHL